MESPLIEVCVDSMASAREAVRGGADRLELCANLIIGGTTPSPALIREAAQLGVPMGLPGMSEYERFVTDAQAVAAAKQALAAAVRANECT